MLDAFASSGSSPTFPLIVLLLIDLVAWFFFVRFLQMYTGRRASHIAAEDWYTKVRAKPGRAISIFGARPSKKAERQTELKRTRDNIHLWAREGMPDDSIAISILGARPPKPSQQPTPTPERQP